MRLFALALGCGVAAISLLSACGGTVTPTLPAPTATSTTDATATPPAETSPTPAVTPTPAGPVTLTVANKALGAYIADTTGRSLYMNTRDTKGTTTPNCTGTCLTVWPPLTSADAPTAGANVTADLISTITLPDGSKQATYNGYPLYYSYADSKPGDINGENQGGVWFLISPQGEAVKPLPVTVTPGAVTTPAATTTPATPTAVAGTPAAGTPAAETPTPGTTPTTP